MTDPQQPSHWSPPDSSAVCVWSHNELPDAPLVSIMIPTFKRPQLLQQAVQSALAQHATSFEVVVVDNDPQTSEVDAVIAALASPRLRLFRNPSNLGMFGNWNRCLELARGRWVTILNDDDLLAPSFLPRLLQALEGRPDAFLIACKAAVLDERPQAFDNWLYRLRARVNEHRAREAEGTVVELRAEDYFLNNPHHGSLGILFRREAAIAMGGFDPNLYPSADFAFFSRLQQRGTAYLLCSELATYRVLHNESKSAAVTEGWITQGLQLRQDIAERLDYQRWLLTLYSRLMAVQTARSGKTYWGAELDVSATLRKHGLRNFPAYPFAVALRYVLTHWVFRGTR